MLVTQQAAHEGVGVEDRPGVGVEDEDAVFGGLEESPVTQFGALQGEFGPTAVGHVLDGQEDQVRVFALRRKAAGIEQHAPGTDRGEVVLDLEVVDGYLPGDRLQQRPQSGDVPLTVAKVIEEASLRLVLPDLESPVVAVHRVG